MKRKVQVRVEDHHAYNFIGLISGLMEDVDLFKNVSVPQHQVDLESLTQNKIIMGDILINSKRQVHFVIVVEKEPFKGINEVDIELNGLEAQVEYPELNETFDILKELLENAKARAKGNQLFSYYLHGHIHTRTLRLKNPVIVGDNARLDPTPLDRRASPTYANHPMPVLNEQIVFSFQIIAPSVHSALHLGHLELDNMASLLSVMFRSNIVAGHGAGGGRGTEPPVWVNQLKSEFDNQLPNLLPEGERYGIMEMKVPENFHAIWHILSDMDKEERGAVFESSKLYQMALDIHNDYPRLAMIYLVSSIEILAKLGSHGRDDLLKRFTDFCLSYGQKDAEHNVEYYERIYDQRSRHLHQYGLREPQSRLVLDLVLYSVQYLKFERDYDAFEYIVSKIIINFINSKTK